MANEQAKAFIDQATQSLQNSQFQQALDLVDQAIAIDPKASDSQVLRGICLSQLGQPDAATEAFRKAIMLSPYNVKAYYNLAVHQNSLGNKKEAAELAKEAVGVDPRHAAAKQLLLQLDAELAGTPHDPSGSHHDPGDLQPPPTPQSTGVGSQDLPNQPTAADFQSAAPPPRRPSEGGSSVPAGSPYVATPTSQFSAAGYTRPGYEQSAHSIPWVEGMGTGWATIGWVLSAVSAALFVVGMFMAFSAFQAALSAGGAAAAGANYNSLMFSPLGIVGLLVRILCVVWIVVDVVDRRSGWGWVVGLVILGCCLCVPWLILPIYLLAGRKP